MNLGHFLTVPAASIIALGTLVAIQGMKGTESKLALVVGYVGGWFLLFGVAAALPKMFTKAARESVIKAFVAFGAGGAATSILFGILVTAPVLGIFEFIFPLLFLLPWLLGAAFWHLHRLHVLFANEATKRPHERISHSLFTPSVPPPPSSEKTHNPD